MKPSARNQIKGTLALLALLAAVAPAHAGCNDFKWSVAKEREWFAASPAALPAKGGTAEVDMAYALALAQGAELPVAPERSPGKDSYAGVVTLPQLAAGVYQITLSQEAWIDVATNGALVKSSDFSGQKDCPGVRKTVRFQLGDGPVTVEISNASVDKLLIAIARAP